METYELFRIGFYVCLAFAALFLVLSILLFFMFDIRGILMTRTGKIKAKTVQPMQDAGVTFGRMRQKNTKRNTSGNREREKLVVKKGVVLTPEQISGSGITEEFNKTGDNTGSDASATAVLGANAAETSVLDSVTQRYGESETTVPLQSSTVQAAEGVRFEIVKKLILCDTQEVIG